MDQELIAYLDKRFDEVNKRMDGLEGAVRANGKEIESLRGAVGEEIEGLRGVVGEEIEGLRGVVGEEIKGLRGAIRANGVEIEGLRVDIKQVSEGVAACNQRIDAFQVQVDARFDELGKLFHTSHANLHRRVSVLEAKRERRT